MICYEHEPTFGRIRSDTRKEDVWDTRRKHGEAAAMKLGRKLKLAQSTLKRWAAHWRYRDVRAVWFKRGEAAARSLGHKLGVAERVLKRWFADFRELSCKK